MITKNNYENKIKHLLEKNIAPFPRWDFEKKLPIKEIFNKYQKYSREQLQELKQKNIIICGRVVQKRLQGKACFFDIKDFYGKIQVYANEKILPEKDFYVVKHTSIGDFVLIKGTIMRTKMKELTLRSVNVKHLSRAIFSIPEHFHGLKDKEEIYRKRYLDLISNSNSITIAKNRMNIIWYIRNFFNDIDYYEAETPILQSIYGGAAAKPFTTYHNSLKQNFYLRIATEIALKKLIVGGFEKVYEIGRLFRNEGISYKHNPEFTSLEAYCAYENLDYMKNLTKNLFQHLAKKLNLSNQISYENKTIDISDKEWKSISMNDIVKKYTKIDFSKIKSFEEARQLCRKKNISLAKHQNSIGFVLNLFFEHFVEKKIINPTFVTEYPIEISPFAKKLNHNENFTERFELFIAGSEYANAFTELNNAYEQFERFKFQKSQKLLGNDEANNLDSSFIEALAYGCPPFAGIGIGIDRLVMFFTNSISIKDVLLFPTLKDNKNEKK